MPYPILFLEPQIPPCILCFAAGGAIVFVRTVNGCLIVRLRGRVTSITLIAPVLRRMSSISLSPASLGKISSRSSAVCQLLFMAFTSKPLGTSAAWPSNSSITCK
ncbi:hypothetical protein WN944_015574 [Citrus x changshan-huyou]|uniref:Uncharacterized protein n=1 Tax=Citrus x changshan-huyou TaxID=2935761 RepID=A0AAP0QR79_9ROSI